MTKRKILNFLSYITNAVVSIVLSAILISAFFLSKSERITAHAQSDSTVEGYSSVLEDLSKDGSFSALKYPNVANDYSLQVIQIAESDEGQLFVYVYQPSDSTTELVATSINFSTAINDSLCYMNYRLELVSSEGVFDKYLVKNFVVLKDALRYYDISAIYRSYNSVIDKASTSGGTTSEVSYAVAQRWTATTVNGNVSYNMIYKDVIVIESIFPGFLRYSDGFFLWWGKSCDSHFVAFSTDKPIDKLMSARVGYTQSEYHFSLVGVTVNERTSAPEEKYVDLSYLDEAGNKADGWFAKEYTWNRIEKVEDFIANEDLTEEALAALEGKEWVLRFAETEFFRVTAPNSVEESYSIVSDVFILQLAFETDGKIYNLGTVGHKVNEDLAPDNNNTNELDFNIFPEAKSFFENLSVLLKTVVSLVGLLFLAFLVSIVLKPVIELIFSFFKKE